MSFSTPAMTGSTEVRDAKNERPYISSHATPLHMESPWRLKVPGASAPASTASPWQVGAPSAYMPWQVGAPSSYMPWQVGTQSACNGLHPYTHANPWSGIIPTTSGLAPVDIKVLSESEQTTAEKNKDMQTSSLDTNSDRRNASITWSSAEELAEALFPTKEDENTTTLMKTHAQALLNHKEEIENAHSRMAQHAKALSHHKQTLTGVKNDIEDHDKLFENHKNQIGKLKSQLKATSDTQHEVFLNYKSNIEQLHNSAKDHKSEVNKRLLEHDVSLKNMKSEFDKMKLKISAQSPDTQAKLKDLHLRTSHIEKAHSEKLSKLQERIDSETNFLKREIRNSQGVESKHIVFDHMTPPRRKM